VRGLLLALVLLLQGCGWYFLEHDPNELKAGDVAPVFSLTAATGETVSSSDLLARGHAVLVFYRGHW
jgi:hypothetical protein